MNLFGVAGEFCSGFEAACLTTAREARPFPDRDRLAIKVAVRIVVEERR